MAFNKENQFAKVKNYVKENNEEQKDIRINYIIDKWLSGYSKSDLRMHYKDKFGEDIHGSNILKLATERLHEQTTEKCSMLKDIQIERYEDIYRRALARNNLDSALKALDGINKICKLYDAPIVYNQVTTFKFGDMMPETHSIIEVEPDKLVSKK